MTQKELRHQKYLKNKSRELLKMKEWQERNKKVCSCGKKIQYRSKTCKSCSNSNEKHYGWKGEDAGYLSLHQWIGRKLGKPSICMNCQNTKAKRYDWANVSYLYKRNLSDWIRLCRSCHMKRDIEQGNGKSLEVFPERVKDMTRVVVD
jgi:hypothetical protein